MDNNYLPYIYAQKNNEMINSIDIQIRETNTDDFDSIMTVEKQAFGYDKEAQLVADLWLIKLQNQWFVARFLQR